MGASSNGSYGSMTPRSRDEGGARQAVAIARDVARRHGGTLTVARSAYGGALFELTLPQAPREGS